MTTGRINQVFVWSGYIDTPVSREYAIFACTLIKGTFPNTILIFSLTYPVKRLVLLRVLETSRQVSGCGNAFTSTSKTISNDGSCTTVISNVSWSLKITGKSAATLTAHWTERAPTEFTFGCTFRSSGSFCRIHTVTTDEYAYNVYISNFYFFHFFEIFFWFFFDFF